MILAGRTWDSLSDKEKETLLNTAIAVDGTTCDTPKESMECIVDFECGLSANGFYNDETGEITVYSDSVLYDPAE